MQFKFELGEPFKPYGQLMGVLPAASRELIPEAFRVKPYYEHNNTELISLSGFDDRCELSDSGFLSPRIRARSERKETRMGGSCQDSFH